MAQTEVVAYFENRPVLNKAKSLKEHRPIYDDRDCVWIRIPGDTNRIVVQPANAVWKYDGGLPVTYAQRFPEQFARYKAGQAQTQEGTPLSEATFLTEGKRRELKALSIYTVEALAALEGNQLKALGMGGRDLKVQAQAYLDTAAGGAGNAALLDEIAKLRAEIEAMKNAPAPTTDVDALLALADGNFMAFKSAASKVLSPMPKTKDEIVAALQALKAPKSEFDDYEDQDIRNWLEMAGVKDTANLDRQALIAKAVETNAALKKAA